MQGEQQIKEKVKERYGKIALAGNSSKGCCPPNEDCCGSSGGTSSGLLATSPIQIAKNIGYDIKELESVPQFSE